ncbi:MAG TPA: DUF1549 domain-containing protein, partial [Pirellulaceae bacterium]|nr:DUF1549 domain-containing protein [Pirellulaceae bacterium]
MPSTRCLKLALTLASVIAVPLAGEEITYERDVRPILKTHCFQCHGEGGKLEGGLDVRLRRLIARGGDSGEAFVAGMPDNSLLLQRILDGDMPPEEVALRPTADEVATIQRWIADGAIASRDEPEDLDPDNYITEEERAFWAFQPVAREQPPTVSAAQRVRTPIDQFIIAKLEANNLPISPDADARTLIRRVYFDLLGLPPAPVE